MATLVIPDRGYNVALLSLPGLSLVQALGLGGFLGEVDTMVASLL